MNSNYPSRLPKTTNLDKLDLEFEALLVDAVEKLVRSANMRRARRVHGLLTEFRDASENPTLTEYYKRAVGEAFLDAIAER